MPESLSEEDKIQSAIWQTREFFLDESCHIFKLHEDLRIFCKGNPTARRAAR
jgi:hypothetical protein